jgi:hypothetical protein
MVSAITVVIFILFKTVEEYYADENQQEQDETSFFHWMEVCHSGLIQLFIVVIKNDLCR